MTVYHSDEGSGKKERTDRIEKADVKIEKKDIKEKKKEHELVSDKVVDKKRSEKIKGLKEKIRKRLRKKERKDSNRTIYSPIKNSFSALNKIETQKINNFFSNIIIRILLSLLLAALGALFLTLSFAPYGLWPLVFFAFVPLLTAVHRVAPRRMAGLVMALGIGCFFRLFFNDFFTDADFFLANYFYIAVAMFFFLIGGLQRGFHSRSNYRWFVLEGVALWTGFEMVRGFIPGLGTTGFLATALYKQFWFIQPVSMLSIYGLTLLIIFINYVLTYKVISFIDSKKFFRGEGEPVAGTAAKRWVYLAAAVLIGWFAFSLSLLQSPLPAVRVSAVQPGHYVHETVFSGETRKMFRRAIEFQEDFDELLSISKRAARENARLIVWNEATLPFNPHFRGTDELQDFVKDTGMYLVLGYSVPEDNSEGVTILSPDGVFLGKSYQTLIGSIGTAVSDDIDRTLNFRNISAQGTRIVALSTFHTSKQGPRRLPNVVFRAVENHLSVVNADGHYASAIIDPYGRLIQYTSSESSTRRILVADIPAGSGNTLVVMWGDWLGWLSLGGMAFFLIIMTISHMRARKKKVLKDKDLQNN